uniref:RNA-directed DNA polymerase n=1 Tax=Fagus sylvatica TaxID=28930 RepID=A0A2N9EQY4_FAGSY
MEEEAVSENNLGGARLPTFNHRRIRSEVRAPGGQRGREEQRSYGRIEGRHHSPSKEPSFLGEARKKRRIEELEEELRFLKEEDKEKGDQRRRKRSRSYSAEIEQAKFPARFVPPNLAVYDGKSDPVGHLSRYWQSMALHTSNDPLMCRIFLSSLGEVGLRWFNRLDHRSIRSWQEMSESFTARFITNTRKPKEIDALLALKMKAGETLKSYSARYWEVYNDIDACDEDIVVKTFRFGLNEDIKLRRSLTKRPPLSMADLMTRLEEHIRVEDDPKSSARTVEAAPPVDKKTTQPKHNQAKRSKRSADQPRVGTCMAVHTVFNQPIYRLLPFIKDQPYFEWPAKMPGDPATRKGKPYCSYHRERGHLTEQCRAYKYHLEQLVKNGHLRQYIDETKNSQQSIEAPKLKIKDSAPIGIIDVFQIGDSAQMAPVPLKKESTEQILFTNQDLEGVQVPHSDALVVTLRIGEFDVKRILIDPGSSVEIMYESLFKGLGLEKKDLSLVEGPLSGFSGETVVPTGKVTINVKAGTVSIPTDFFVLNAFSPYNAILGRPWLHRMGADPFHTPPAVEVPNPAGSHGSPGGPTGGQTMPGGRDQTQSQLHQETGGGPDGDSLTGEHRTQLLTLLEEYQDIFAWTPYEAPGVDPEFVSHALNVSPEYKPVVQKARRTAPQHAEAMREEVERLLKVGAVREVLYPQWLSNTIVVKKKNGKWRVCVDFTDLNKACPKDPFPLPKIDQLVDSTVGHERMSFLDAFQGYHQIALRKEDQEKTAFITPRGIFCYKVMPFGLKNAGETYQRMVTKMFSELLGKTVEVYIDDMVVKSVKSTDHVGDWRKVFEILKRHNLKLNATKCTFGVGFGEVLGFLGNTARHRGKPGPNSSYPRTSTPQEPPQKVPINTPLLSSPKEGEPLYIYLAASDKAVSAAIVRNGPGEQRPVYYTSKTMNGAETRYLPLEKSALALFITAKKLPHYFQAHTMIVLTSLPLKALFRSSNFSGHISKWGAHLGAYDVRYRPRTSIKGQVLADFVAEFAPEHSELPTIEEHPRSAEQIKEKNWWTLYVDGTENSRGSGLGIVLMSPGGEMVEQAVRLGFGASNNEAEYEALLHGLKAAKRLGASFLNIRCDSQLIVNQLTGEYMAKDERMMAYRDLAKDLLKTFYEFNIERVGREHNGHADSLAGLASSVAPDFRRTITVEVQDSPSIMKSSPAIICQIETGPSWMDPILNYLTKDMLPADQKEAAKIRRDVTRYWVSREGKLYKKSYTGPYLLCVHPDLVPDLLYEIHEGVCGDHMGGRSLAHRAIGQGYWWPYMQKDAAQYVRRCKKCQLFAPAIHKPASQLNPISSPWPFAQWGLDLVGPLPRATGNRQWLIVATDYFTKWVEAEPLARITDSESRKFIWKNIITRFGIPRCLISDNGTQFDSGPFKKLEEAKGRWVEELPTILWTFRTTPRSSTGETPFSLTYGVEAVIPLEVGLPTLRSEEYDQENNELMLARDMDLAQERKDLAMIRLASYQGDLKKKYGKNVSARSLAPGDMVLQKSFRKQKGPLPRQTRSKLGRTLSGRLRGRTGSIQPQGNGRQTPQKTLEYKQPEEVLPVGRYTGRPERHQNPGHAQVLCLFILKWYGRAALNPSHARCLTCKSSSGMVGRHQNPGHAQVLCL